MRGVCVRVTGRDPRQSLAPGWPARLHKDGATWVGASGVALPADRGAAPLVVTSGTLLVPFLTAPAAPDASSSPPALAAGTRVEVLLPDAGEVWREARLERVYCPREAVEALLQLTGGRDQSAWGLGWREAGQPLAPAWDPHTAASLALLRLLPTPPPSSSSSSSPSPPSSSSSSSSTFSSPSSSSSSSSSSSAAWVSAASLAQGDGLLVYGSPYGLLAPHVFFNCLATGVVSGRLEAPPPLVHDDHRDGHDDDQATKASQPQPSTRFPLLLTDARCIPGCEGGPAFNNQRQFAGLNLIIAADVVMSVVQQHHHHLLAAAAARGSTGASSSSSSPASFSVMRPVPPRERKPTEPSAAVRRAQKSLVLLEVGNSWASGIVLSATGYILTNAHVVRPYLSATEDSVLQAGISVRVRVEDDQHSAGYSWLKADLVFASSSCIDVALLRLKNDRKWPPLVPASFAQQTPRVGDSIFVIGYPLFFPSIGQGCLCTGGKVAKVVTTSDGTPGAIQTTAAVHNGNSGGALINNAGRVVGMVTCNMRRKGNEDEAAGVIIPRLNLSIPVHLLAPVLSFIRDPSSSDARVALAPLNEARRELDEVWKLQRLSAFPSLPPDSKFGRFVRAFAPDPRTASTSSSPAESPPARGGPPFASSL